VLLEYHGKVRVVPDRIGDCFGTIGSRLKNHGGPDYCYDQQGKCRDGGIHADRRRQPTPLGISGDRRFSRGGLRNPAPAGRTE
jgi:hypothetical protein